MSQNWIAGSLCLLHISLRKKGRQCNMRRFFGPFSCHLLLRHSFLLQTVQCKATKWDNLWGFGYSSYFITAIIFVTSDGKRSNICSYKESKNRISATSFLENYSFLEVGVRQVFKGGNYWVFFTFWTLWGNLNTGRS